ncbi:hypothetical protein [Streptomonospora litoralis]|nr:hypothetical protein [Streptomonospora litoralis]
MAAERSAAMHPRFAGLLIGSSFGAVFVCVNVQPPLPAAASATLRVAAVAAFLTVVALGFAAARRGAFGESGADDASAGRPPMFGRGFLLVVAAEAVVLFGGFPVLRELGAPAEANLAWIALVVGVHFIALAAVWRAPSVAVPGAALALLSAAGFALAAAALAPLVPLVSGVGSGAVLLGAGIAATGRAFLASRV